MRTGVFPRLTYYSMARAISPAQQHQQHWGALLVEVRCSSVAHGRRNMDGNPEILLHSFNFDHISEPGI
jgi:hypothetical protein